MICFQENYKTLHIISLMYLRKYQKKKKKKKIFFY